MRIQNVYCVQDKICISVSEMECVNTIKVDASNCLKPCSGLIITSLSKSEMDRKLDKFSAVIDEYNNYKKLTDYPVINKYNHQLNYEWKNNLRFVRIYFDTQTFDRITKERAAKFEDMLSTIGGTMGLLTGFSIISALWGKTRGYSDKHCEIFV